MDILTKELADAILQAQKTITHTVKDAANPYFKSSYATLENVIGRAKEAFNEQGVFFQQVSHENPEGATIETILIGHGGSLSTGKVSVPVDKKDPQKYGGALTYARRYSLTMAAGIGSVDDDAEVAMDRDITGKYKIISIDGQIAFSTNSVKDYLAHCRSAIGKPNLDLHQALFKKNQWNIETCFQDADGTPEMEALENLKKAYENIAKVNKSKGKKKDA